MGRKGNGSTTQPHAAQPHAAVRLDEATIERIDALREIASSPFQMITRSDVLRALILSGLEVMEGKLADKAAGTSPP